MKFNYKDRTEMLKVRVSKEEKILIETKAEMYGKEWIEIRDSMRYEIYKIFRIKKWNNFFGVYNSAFLMLVFIFWV